MFQVFHDSRAGGHADNEDAFAVGPHPQDPGCLLCVVADGQGGRAGGGLAARTACRATIEAAGRRPPAELLRPVVWAALLGGVDKAVARNPGAGFTTLVALCIGGGLLVGASSGDSAAVVVQGEEPAAVLTRHQFKNPPVGSGEALFLGFGCPLNSPWSVLALTDGVWKYAGWDRVLAAARLPGPEVLDTLREQAALPGSGQLPDDFTLVVIRE